MVQTRHQQEQSDPPPPAAAQRHRYATRSASRAESSDLGGGGECGVCDDVSSRPPAPPPSSSAQKKKKTKQPAADDEDDGDEPQQQQRASRRKAAAPALAPVVEEEDESESESDDGGDGPSSDDSDSEDAADEEEAAMLQSLAASIEAAFKQKKTTMAPAAAAAPAAPAAAAAPAKSSSSESDEESDDPDADPKTKKIGLWQPSTGLKPAPPAARVALTHLGVDPTTTLRPSGVTAASARAAPLDPKTAAKAARDAAKNRPDTAGAKWYDLPATAITDDVKRELRLLRLRGAYDPKRFYRSYDGGKFPRYFAVATVEDDPLEPSSARLSRRERKRATITEQLLADSHLSDARKRRFDRLQEEAARLAGMGKSGERGLAAKRQRKSSLPRLPKSHHRKKH